MCVECVRPASAGLRIGTAGFKPALGNGVHAGGFAGDKLAVEVEDPAVSAFALAALDGDGSAEPAGVGFLGGGRNNVVAHGDSGFEILIHEKGEVRAIKVGPA